MGGFGPPCEHEAREWHTGFATRCSHRLRFERPYREEIAYRDEFAGRWICFVTLYIEIRSHETLGFRVPIDLYRED